MFKKPSYTLGFFVFAINRNTVSILLHEIHRCRADKDNSMKVLRTPDERFNHLSDYSFEPNYVTVADGEGGELRIHYVDEGDGEIVLMMHGEPSWSYLYRHMITLVVAAGYRVIAPDLVGFGRSDKPASRTDYTYERHVNWMTEALLNKLDLNNITLVCQDWGGLLGLRMVAENPERFARVVAANTMLPTGDHDLGDAFRSWCDFSQKVPEFAVGSILNNAAITDLSEEIIRAYDAPFPDESYKEGARQFPTLVPATPDDPATNANRAAWTVLSQWQKPFLTAFSDSDPITAGGDRVMQKLIPGAEGQNHTTIANGGHFLQEDKGEELAQVVIDFMIANP
jgi:haloalkane dehalogenase